MFRGSNSIISMFASPPNGVVLKIRIRLSRSLFFLSSAELLCTRSLSKSEKNRIYYRSLMQIEKSQPEGERIMWETRFTEFPALSVDPRVVISRSHQKSEKPCINNEFHAPLIHRYFTSHMQDSGQYSINTEEASRLQLKLSIKQFTQELCRFG